MTARVVTLLRRAKAASTLGFLFTGTTRTPFPRSARLLGRKIPLDAPPDGGYTYDIINIWLDDEYGMRNIDPAPRTIVDIGANIGIFSLWAAHCYPQATIHAYEPNGRVLAYARENLKGTQVQLFSQGVGLTASRARMIDTRESRMASTEQCADGEVEIVPLAQVVERVGGTIDLLKIDCEGAEWDMLKDTRALQAVRAIRMEYHLVDGHSMADFHELVKNIGFTVDSLVPNKGFGIAWLRNGTAARQRA